jgi:hypothetical protein
MATRNDTTKALRAALNAARQEREELSERLTKVEQLITDLSVVLDSGAAAPSASRTRRPGRKATRKRAGRKTAAKRQTRKQTTRKAAKRSAAKRQPAGRTDRVVEIVNRAGQPMSTGDVRSRLSDTEPQVSSKLVSAALSYAQRKGRIGKTDDGRWTAA